MNPTAELARTSLPTVDSAEKMDAGIDYQLFLDCVHCGLCTSACPTYVELGDENDSPRGRIYLMRALTDGRISLDAQVQKHLDLCLDCRACETACPSGVQYGKLIEPFRIHLTKQQSAPSLGWMKKWVLFQVTPYRWKTRLALAPAKLLQWTGVDWLLRKMGFFRIMPSFLRQMHDMLPRLQRHYGALPEVLPAEGKKRARVGLFLGCASDSFFPQTNLATARVLQANGCEVWVPSQQVCCGALHYHSAQEEPAQDFARKNLELFGQALKNKEIDALIVNAAGCGAMLKEYDHLLPSEANQDLVKLVADKTRDISEFLAELGPIEPKHPIPLRATYHDACHLCHGQQIREQPRQLLQMVPELELVPLAETEICCGAAGSYNLTQPEMAERLGLRKAENILETKAQVVVSGNVGCLLQIGRYLREKNPDIWVGHPVDLLWASYSGHFPGDFPKKK